MEPFRALSGSPYAVCGDKMRFPVVVPCIPPRPVGEGLGEGIRNAICGCARYTLQCEGRLQRSVGVTAGDYRSPQRRLYRTLHGVLHGSATPQYRKKMYSCRKGGGGGSKWPHRGSLSGGGDTRQQLQHTQNAVPRFGVVSEGSTTLRDRYGRFAKCKQVARGCRRTLGSVLFGNPRVGSDGGRACRRMQHQPAGGEQVSGSGSKSRTRGQPGRGSELKSECHGRPGDAPDVPEMPLAREL